jgi:hypothetical protein
LREFIQIQQAILVLLVSKNPGDILNKLLVGFWRAHVTINMGQDQFGGENGQQVASTIVGMDRMTPKQPLIIINCRPIQKC